MMVATRRQSEREQEISSFVISVVIFVCFNRENEKISDSFIVLATERNNAELRRHRDMLMSEKEIRFNSESNLKCRASLDVCSSSCSVFFFFFWVRVTIAGLHARVIHTRVSILMIASGDKTMHCCASNRTLAKQFVRISQRNNYLRKVLGNFIFDAIVVSGICKTIAIDCCY